jgi:hypothetical protein
LALRALIAASELILVLMRPMKSSVMFARRGERGGAPKIRLRHEFLIQSVSHRDNPRRNAAIRKRDPTRIQTRTTNGSNGITTGHAARTISSEQNKEKLPALRAAKEGSV